MAVDIELHTVVIEIPEEAYKQNAVYRPWKDIQTSELTIRPEDVEVSTPWSGVRNSAFQE